MALKKAALSLFLFHFSCWFVLAQPGAVGSSSAGMGGVGLCFPGLWSGVHNPAGISTLSKARLGGSISNPFGISELARKALATAIPFPGGVAGAELNLVGFQSYQEWMISFGVARSFGPNIHSGIRFHYFVLNQPSDYGRLSQLIPSVGIIAKLSEGWSLGSSWFNPFNQTFQGRPYGAIKPRLAMGFSFSKKEELSFGADIEKESGNKPRLKAGLSFQLVPSLCLRAGCSSGPGAFSFGLGYQLRGLRLDIAFSLHPVLGYSPFASLETGF